MPRHMIDEVTAHLRPDFMSEQSEMVSIFGRKPTRELKLLAAQDARLQNVRQSIWRQKLLRCEPQDPHWLQLRAQTAAYYAESSSNNPDVGKHVELNGSVPCDDTIRKLLQKLWPVMSDKSQQHVCGELFTALTADLYRVLFHHDTLPAHLVKVLAEQDWQIHTGPEAALDFSAFVLLLLDFMILWIPDEEAARSAHGTYFVRLVTSVADFDHDTNVLCIKPLENVRCWLGPRYERIRRDSMSTYKSVVSSSSAERVHAEHADTKAPTWRSPNHSPTRPSPRIQHSASQLWTYPDSPSRISQGQSSPQSRQLPQISITVGPWLINDVPCGSPGATQHEETAIPYSFPSPDAPPQSPVAEHSESVTHAASYTIPPASAPRKKPRPRTADEWTRSPQRYLWRSAAEGLLRPAASNAVLEANQLAVERMIESRERRQAQEQARVAARRQEIPFAASASMALQVCMQNKGAMWDNRSVRSAVRGGGGHHSRGSKRLKCNQEGHHPPIVSLKAAGRDDVTCHMAYRRWSLSRRQTRSSRATNDDSVPRTPSSTSCSAMDTAAATAHVPQDLQLMPETVASSVVDATESQSRKQGSLSSHGSIRYGRGSMPSSHGGKVRADTGGKRGSRSAVGGGEAERPSTTRAREQRAVVHVNELLGVHVLKDRCASAPSAERTKARLSRRLGVRGCFKALDAESSNTDTIEGSRVAVTPGLACVTRPITVPESQLSELFVRLSKTRVQSRLMKYDLMIIPKLSKARSHARSMVEYVEAAHVAPWETYNKVLKVLKSRTPTKIPRSQYNSTLLGPAILPVDCRPSSVYT